MAKLMAFPDVVSIDRKAGQRVGTTSVLYQADAASNLVPRLWERVVGQSWVRIPLSLPRIESSPSGDFKRDGTFSQALKAGQVYQVVLYHVDSIDPNAVDPDGANPEQRPDASLTVVALQKDPERRDLIVDQAVGIGGTWFRKVVATRTPTFFMLQVASVAPFTDAQGIERFAAPLHTTFALPNVNHSRLVEPLLPGNAVFYLMRVSDDEGNWQTVIDLFVTKKRKVTIGFDVLHVINDGAQGDTTAEFRIWVMEGGSVVRGYFFGDVDNFEISDRPSPGKEATEFIPLALQCAPFTLGPTTVTDATSEVGILTRGLVFRATGSNEPSRNYFPIGDGFPDSVPGGAMLVPVHAQFPFPTGVSETVHNVPFVVTTTPQGSIEFKYDVTAHFTVEYF
jgi:hypothetical protein